MMFRLLTGGVRIIAFALMGLAVLAAVYPWHALAIGAVLCAAYFHGRSIQRARVLALDVGSMSPLDYEVHCGEVLRAAGWSVQRIGATGDQGVDVLATLRGTRAALQCKRWAGPVGNAAVQAIVAGRRHHGAQIAVVVAPNGYTRAARELAATNGVLLLDHVTVARLEHLARVP